MSYLFAAYALFWALSFAFIFRIASRQRQLERDVEGLKRALERKKE
jgi:CcmD family protein